jgi:hypothetical protein
MVALTVAWHGAASSNSRFQRQHRADQQMQMREAAGGAGSTHLRLLQPQLAAACLRLLLLLLLLCGPLTLIAESWTHGSIRKHIPDPVC